MTRSARALTRTQYFPGVSGWKSEAGSGKRDPAGFALKLGLPSGVHDGTDVFTVILTGVQVDVIAFHPVTCTS